MSELREQMLADMQLKGLTPRTQRDYLREAGNFARYFIKSPDELTEEHIKEYLLHLKNGKDPLRWDVPVLCSRH